MLTKIKEHCIQVVDDKLQEIKKNFHNMNLSITDFYFEYEKINQEFITSIIQLYPEILNTNIEDINQYLSQDFYLKDENQLLDIIEKKTEELK